MYTNSLDSSSNPVTAQHVSNQNRLNKLRQNVSPLPAAALKLAQTAREMKVSATLLKSRATQSLQGRDGSVVQTKAVISALKSAKDTFKSFASKAESLNREIDFFSNHQEGLFRGNMGMFSQADKVNWCASQVKTIEKRTQKLGADQSLPVSKAVRDLQWAAGYFGNSVDTDLGERVNALGRGA